MRLGLWVLGMNDLLQAIAEKMRVLAPPEYLVLAFRHELQQSHEDKGSQAHLL